MRKLKEELVSFVRSLPSFPKILMLVLLIAGAYTCIMVLILRMTDQFQYKREYQELKEKYDELEENYFLTGSQLVNFVAGSYDSPRLTVVEKELQEVKEERQELIHKNDDLMSLINERNQAIKLLYNQNDELDDYPVILANHKVDEQSVVSRYISPVHCTLLHYKSLSSDKEITVICENWEGPSWEFRNVETGELYDNTEIRNGLKIDGEEVELVTIDFLTEEEGSDIGTKAYNEGLKRHHIMNGDEPYVSIYKNK